MTKLKAIKSMEDFKEIGEDNLKWYLQQSY